MFARLPEAAKMMAAKNECEHDQYVPRRITARPGDEVKLLEHARSLKRQADRAGGRPIVEGGGSDQFRRKLV